MSKGDLSCERKEERVLSNYLCNFVISRSLFNGEGEDTTFCPEIYGTL